MNHSTQHAHRRPAVTEIINQWQEGSPTAGDRVMPFLYRRMRAIAANHLRGERTGHTLQATALVHEAILRLRTTRRNRIQFMAFSAHLMRQILVDHARSRGRQKRGGDIQRVPLDVELRYFGVFAARSRRRTSAAWSTATSSPPTFSCARRVFPW